MNKLYKHQKKFLVAFFVLIVLLILSPYTSVLLNFFNLKVTNDNQAAANIIALIAAILTFSAFFVQFSANTLQITVNKTQENNFYLQQLELRFFDYIKIYHENVSNMYIRGYNHKSVFVVLRFEYQRIFDIVTEELKEITNDPIVIANISYSFLYFGIGEKSSILIFEIAKTKEVNIEVLKLIEAKLKSEESNVTFLEEYLDMSKLVDFKLFNGHQRHLGHYYRHLYQTVKFIETSKLSFDDKNQYLKILRAQFSAQEVSILFFHSMSSLGYGWSKRQWKKNEENTSLIEKYNLLGNLPLDGYTELNPKTFFNKSNDWEWEKIKTHNLKEELNK